MITSKSNPQLKKIRNLMESVKARNEQGMFVIEGTRLVSEAPAGLIEGIYISEKLVEGSPEEARDAQFQGLSAETEEMIRGGAVHAEIVSDDVFRALSDTVNPQGILAVVRKPEHSLERIFGHHLYVILDDIRDPGNLGTIIRTSEAAGARVIMSRACVDIFNPKVIRSTMGSIFRVPFAICDTLTAINELQARGVTVCAAALDGSVPYREAEYSAANAFIIGNEANGVSPEAQKAANIRVRIPMEGQVESLNAAVSAAVLLYNMV